MKTVVLAACLALTLPGCLIMSSDKTQTEGTQVSEETLAQIAPGTSEELVLALLGPPTSRKEMSDGTELLRWRFQRTQKRGTAVLVIFAGSTETKETGTIFVILEQGDERRIVQRVWRDGGPITSS